MSTTIKSLMAEAKAAPPFLARDGRVLRRAKGTVARHRVEVTAFTSGSFSFSIYDEDGNFAFSSYDQSEAERFLDQQSARAFGSEIQSWGVEEILDAYARAYAANKFGSHDEDLAILKNEMLSRVR